MISVTYFQLRFCTNLSRQLFIKTPYKLTEQGDHSQTHLQNDGYLLVGKPNLEQHVGWGLTYEESVITISEPLKDF